MKIQDYLQWKQIFLFVVRISCMIELPQHLEKYNSLLESLPLQSKQKQIYENRPDNLLAVGYYL